MTLDECGSRFERASGIRLLTGYLVLVATVTLLQAATWDRAGAQKALEQARSLRAQIANSSTASRASYLRCADTYRQVYAKDPHYSGSDDAIYEQALLYEEMGDKFGVLDDYRHAARLYRFLVSDYGGSPFCPDALLRLGDLCTGPLEDQEEAQKAYQQLKTRYGRSKAAATLKAKGMTVVERRFKPEVDTTAPVPSHPSGQTTGLSSVQNIRYWITNNYTRVAIDMDEEARYHKTRLSDPDRIYFDISNARLDRDLLNRKFVVGDEFLRQVRVAQNRPDVVRVVLDLGLVSSYTVFELHDPFRIIIDINGVHGGTVKTAGSSPQSKPRHDEVGEPGTKVPRPAPGKRVEDLSTLATSSAKSPVPPQKNEGAVPEKSREQKPALVVKDIEPAAPKPAETPPRDAAAVKTNIAAAPSRETTVGKLPSGVEAKPPSTPASASRTTENKPSKPPVVPAPPSRVTEPTPRAAAPTSRGDRTITRMLGLKIGRIVIDPGHGGHDTGTVGPGGLMEKDLVLEVARNLRRLLEEKLNAEVVLTRDDDKFVSLEERTAIANQHQADLFISIHANSSNIRSTSGVETYFLNFARTAAEREVAARENATTVRNVRDLEDLVKKIAQADKSAESRELASIVQRQLFSGAQKIFPSARNRGVRSAPFVVLIGANMPSVLAEVAFISNPRDEKLLKKEESRDRVARALFAGIENYMKTLGSGVAQNHPGSN